MAATSRVHIVASDLGLSDDEVISICRSLGIKADAPSSPLEEDQVRKIKRRISRAKLDKIEEAERIKAEEKAKAKAELEAKKKAAAEKKKRLAEEKRRQEEEKRREVERKKREEEAKKKAEEEKIRKEKEEKERLEAEKKKKEEEEARKTTEQKMREQARREAEELMKKLEDEKRKRLEEEEKQKLLEAQRKEQERIKAEEKALADRKAKIKENLHIVEIERLVAVKSMASKFGMKPADMTTKLDSLGLKIPQTAHLDRDTLEIFSSEIGYEIIFKGDLATDKDREKSEDVEKRIMEAICKEDEEIEERRKAPPKPAKPKQEKVQVKTIKEDKKTETEEEVDIVEIDEPDDPKDLVPRAPVVTVMGHVDHGKTSILDYIKKTKVADREKGGITQHIGAYKVAHQGRDIVFIDTPGHAAFTQMRARGAKVTDIVILVVAADDGIMPQTIEAINHSRSANAPMIVAINKIDKPGTSPDKAKQQLMQHHLLAEEWGGDTIICPVSAITGEGIDHLLEMITIQADIMELKANPKRMMRGVVIESKVTPGRGAVATVLINKGTLKIGDVVICGTSYGKVKAISDDQGKRLKSAGPATPVEIMGLSEPPPAGEIIIQVKDDRQAREIAEKRIDKTKKTAAQAVVKPAFSLEEFLKTPTEEAKELRIILKGDVQGSIEALSASLEKLSTEKAKVNILHSAVGSVGESDVMLAKASEAIIISFSTKTDPNATTLADKEGVRIYNYDIIYNAIEEVRAALEGLLEPVFNEVVVGELEVRQLFKSSSLGNIAGCMVKSGVFPKNAKARVIRDDEPVWEGEILSLKHFKDEVREVKAGLECGIRLKNFDEINVGDIIHAIKLERVTQTL